MLYLLSSDYEYLSSLLLSKLDEPNSPTKLLSMFLLPTGYRFSLHCFSDCSAMAELMWRGVLFSSDLLCFAFDSCIQRELHKLWKSWMNCFST
ncbi:hypothetical protein P8452_57238 [Trifolium repens]|nr:hypothetical protein P8452_57238 [Trifolium repens]